MKNFLLTVSVLLATQSYSQENPTASWAANLHTSATATTSWVENASRTSHVPTRKNAALHELSLAVGQAQQLAPAWLLHVGLNADYRSEPKFNLNDQFEAGPHLSLQYKWGIGPYAPVLQANTSLTFLEARYGGNSGWAVATGLRLSKRLTSSLQIAATAGWREHYARSAVFDLQQTNLGLEGTWDFNDRWRIRGTAGRLSGKIVTHAAPAIWAQAISGGLGATVFNYYSTIPQAVTDLYGPGWVSYNVAADVDLWSLGLAYQISQETSLELRTNRAYVINQIDIRYPSTVWGLSLSHQF